MKNFLFIFLLLFSYAGCFASSEMKNISSAKTAETFSDKTYRQMNEEEKLKFINNESNKVVEKFGQTGGGQINDKAVTLIKKFVDAYDKRNTEPKTTSHCSFGNDLTTVLTRGGKYSQIIGNEFSKVGIPAQTGIYLAMIETEFCPCLQSPTGPLGMFQFTSSSGKTYGLNTQKNATPQNPDDRCDPQLSAQAAAKYVQKMATEDFKALPKSLVYPLAIGAFNSGEAGLSANLKKTLESKEPLPDDVWVWISDSEEFSKRFQAENFKYVPKFFAAAIIGENPQTFGINTAPLSAGK